MSIEPSPGYKRTGGRSGSDSARESGSERLQSIPMWSSDCFRQRLAMCAVPIAT